MPALLTGVQRDGRDPLDGPLSPGARLEAVLPDRLRELPAATRRALVVAAAAEVRPGDAVLAALAREGLGVADLEPAESAEVVELRPGGPRRGRARALLADYASRRHGWPLTPALIEHCGETLADAGAADERFALAVCLRDPGAPSAIRRRSSRRTSCACAGWCRRG